MRTIGEHRDAEVTIVADELPELTPGLARVLLRILVKAEHARAGEEAREIDVPEAIAS